LVEDCVQDVYLKLWAKRNELEIKNMKSYLFSAAKNTFLDAIKKEKIQQKHLRSTTLLL